MEGGLEVDCSGKCSSDCDDVAGGSKEDKDDIVLIQSGNRGGTPGSKVQQ